MPIFKSRTDRRVEQNLGIIKYSKSDDVCRSQELKTVDKYLASTQYDHLAPWNEQSEECIPIRARKPLIIYPIPKLFTDRLSAKLLGKSVFPQIKIEEDPDTEEFLKMIIKSSWFKAKMLQASKCYISHGSVFVRFKLANGSIVLEHFNPNYCYPKMDQSGNLLEVEIKYIFDDENDKDQNGKPKKKWYKLVLGQMSDTFYDSPEFKVGTEPVFHEVNTNEHELGFVQGSWIRNIDIKNSVDGFSILLEILDFCDSFNYTLSQSDKAVAYGQEQQAWIRGLKDTEVEELIKSASNAWNLGKEGETGFLEAQMSGYDAAKLLREELLQGMQQIVRVLLLDPEKIVGSAQSAKAMEVLYGPMIEIIDEIRPNMEKGIIELLQKMAATLLIYNKRGQELSIGIPEGYVPQSLDIELQWPPVFAPTMQDLAEIVRVATTASNANIISRETATRYVAKFFDIEDIEAEVAKVNAQPQLGGFF